MNDNSAGRIECRKICPLAVSPPLRAEIPFADHAAFLHRTLKFKSGKAIEVKTITATHAAVDRYYRKYLGFHRLHGQIPSDARAACRLPERLHEMLMPNNRGATQGGSEHCPHTSPLPYFSLTRLPDQMRKK